MAGMGALPAPPGGIAAPSRWAGEGVAGAASPRGPAAEGALRGAFAGVDTSLAGVAAGGCAWETRTGARAAAVLDRGAGTACAAAVAVRAGGGALSDVTPSGAALSGARATAAGPSDTIWTGSEAPRRFGSAGLAGEAGWGVSVTAGMNSDATRIGSAVVRGVALAISMSVGAPTGFLAGLAAGATLRAGGAVSAAGAGRAVGLSAPGSVATMRTACAFCPEPGASRRAGVGKASLLADGACRGAVSAGAAAAGAEGGGGAENGLESNGVW
ncbi:hypothetical protein [Bordetella genomosp. 13]|uniref:hypothetical protein n=1 Tax=Bordetella genomosp. 13 TaxID=463040 RepID=UPI0016424063|nr:hypothetical protein [Bordetella genomosp. 13]